MKRRLFLLGSIFLVAFLCSFVLSLDIDEDGIPNYLEEYYEIDNCQNNPLQLKPNVLIIMADDMGLGDSKTFFPQSKINTPQLDEMAQEGVLLTNHRGNPLCTRSRAALLAGVTGQAKGPEVDMIAEYFKSAGYSTGAFGKWHNGDGTDGTVHPLDRGFDTFLGFIGGGRQYKRSLRSAGIINGREPYTSNDWSHTTDLFADKTIDFITQSHSANKPFFGWLAFNAVHTPYWEPSNPVFQSTDEWLNKVENDGVINNAEKDYYALVEHMDDRIGDILDHLDDLDISENTLVIFLSDNGALTPMYYYQDGTNRKFSGDNAGLRAGKASVYEGGMRVPCIMRWPGVIPNGVISEASISNFDLYPTFRELLGTTTAVNNSTVLPGRSILGFLTNNCLDTRHKVPYSAGFGGNRCLVYGDWKYVSHPRDLGEVFGEPAVSGDQLFHLPSDPSEQNNLAQSYPQKVTQLKRLLADYATDRVIIDTFSLIADEDCVPNYLDIDSDNDGISDKTEGTIDTDGDGIPNFIDTDSDNDCKLDAEEGLADLDRNGLPDYIDPDISQDCYLELLDAKQLFLNDTIHHIYILDDDGDGQTNFQELDGCRNSLDAGDLAFHFNGSTEGFSLNQIDDSDTTSEMYWELRGDNMNDPFIRKDDLSINANELTQIKVKLKSSVAGECRLYWRSENRKSFLGQFSSDVYVTPNTWQELEFNLEGNELWDNQRIITLRFDFPTDAGTEATYELDWIRGQKSSEKEGCNIVSVQSHLPDNDQLNIYPTVVESSPFIHTPDVKSTSNLFRILNSNGKILKELTLIKGENKVDVSSLTKGVYFLQGNGKSYQFYKK